MSAYRHVQLGVRLHLLSREAPDVSEGGAQAQPLGKIQGGVEVGHVAWTRALGRGLGRGVKTVRCRGEIDIEVRIGTEQSPGGDGLPFARDLATVGVGPHLVSKDEWNDGVVWRRGRLREGSPRLEAQQTGVVVM